MVLHPPMAKFIYGSHFLAAESPIKISTEYNEGSQKRLILPFGVKAAQDAPARGARGSTRRPPSTVSRNSQEEALPPTTESERSRVFSLTLTTILSCMYAVFIITVGVIIFICDIFVNTAIAEIYCLYLVVVGFLYITYLLVDIRLYINKARKYHKNKKKTEDAYDAIMRQSEMLDEPITLKISKNDDFISSTISYDLPGPLEPLEHPYCFSHGRHTGSFYLKLGAAGFCLGHLVHSALLLSVQVVYVTSEADCGSISILVLDVVYPVYSFCQLFFIFKYSNVIILKSKGLGRFALMHCIASSLCFWIWTIIRETMDSLRTYAKNTEKNAVGFADPSGQQPVALALTSYRMPGSLQLRHVFNITSLTEDDCSSEHGFDMVFDHFSPYMYPFTIEYNILIVGIFYILWKNIGNCPKVIHDDTKNYSNESDDYTSFKSIIDTEQCKLPSTADESEHVSNMVIHIDCHSSNKGLFGGLMILVLTLVSLIVCFITLTSDEFVEVGVTLKDLTELVLHATMLVAVLTAYGQIKLLDVNKHPISSLDDLLLFICIPAFFMEATFTFLPTIMRGNFLKFTTVVLLVLQVLVQTPFIMDALRRCSNSKQLQRAKPGRELVTFLVVCNVATWIFETFTVKNTETDEELYDFYGKVLWAILGHVSTPLCMFYRFHSSVCLADIWKCAYQPGNKH